MVFCSGIVGTTCEDAMLGADNEHGKEEGCDDTRDRVRSWDWAWEEKEAKARQGIERRAYPQNERSARTR